MFEGDIPEENDFERDPSEPAIEELQRFLGSYGLTDSLADLQRDKDDKLPIKPVAERLPDTVDGNDNAAKTELKEYRSALPPQMRSGGIWMEPRKMLSMLMKRTEFFAGLAEDVVRTCKGTECPHFEVCPFKEIVADNREEDQIPCAVDRGVVEDAVEDFIDPTGTGGLINPDRTAQAYYFRQLVYQLVRQNRIQMTLKSEDLLQDYYEILQQDQTGREEFRQGNKTVHPLHDALFKVEKRVEKTIDKMGVAPKFQMRQDMWEADENRLDPDELAEKRMLEEVEESLRRMKNASDTEELKEKVSRDKLLEEALEDIKSRQSEEERNDE